MYRQQTWYTLFQTTIPIFVTVWLSEEQFLVEELGFSMEIDKALFKYILNDYAISEKNWSGIYFLFPVCLLFLLQSSNPSLQPVSVQPVFS